MKNNQEIAQSVSRAEVVASSPLLINKVATRWWDRQLTAATMTDSTFLGQERITYIALFKTSKKLIYALQTVLQR